MVSQLPDKITVFQDNVAPLSALANALTDLGVQTQYVKDDDISAKDLGENTAVILSIASSSAGQSRPLVDMNFSEWMESADDPQFRLLTVLQQLRAALGERPCKVVVIGPTIGVTGAAGHSALATAAEGQRGLMKSIARQWAPQLRFAWLSVWAPLLFPDISTGELPEQCELGEYTPSLGGRPDWRGVAQAALGLINAADAVTGQTTIIDGGEWMLP